MLFNQCLWRSTGLGDSEPIQKGCLHSVVPIVSHKTSTPKFSFNANHSFTHTPTHTNTHTQTNKHTLTQTHTYTQSLTIQLKYTYIKPIRVKYYNFVFTALHLFAAEFIYCLKYPMLEEAQLLRYRTIIFFYNSRISHTL